MASFYSPEPARVPRGDPLRSPQGGEAGWPVVRGCRSALGHVSPPKQLKRRKNYCPVHSTLQSQNGE